MVTICKINSVIKKCIKKGYSMKVAQRYLKMRCSITVSNEVLTIRHKLLKK